MNQIWEWARRLKNEVVVLWFCTRHPRTPFVAKALAAGIVAYALSSIDLIPDFIPVLGYLDDAILLPALIWLALRMLPPDVLQGRRSIDPDLLVVCGLVGMALVACGLITQ